jgi:hypothetical protein
MNYLQTPPPKLKAGEYVILRGADTEAERTDIQRVLRNNGCKAVRFEPMSDGRLQAHGYMALVYGPEVVAL